jgi:hypothetical protein
MNITEEQFLSFLLDHHYQKPPFEIRGVLKAFTVAEALAKTERTKGAKDVLRTCEWAVYNFP